MKRRQLSKSQTTSLARRVINAAAIPPPVVAKTYFLPTAIPGCQLWLDAADSSSVITTGTNVTGWNDKSGNGYHMNMLTPNATWTGTAVYPTIGTSINGLQTVNFNAQAGLKQSTTLDGVKNLFWVGRIAAPVGSGANFYYLLGHDSLYEWTGQAYGGKFIDVGFSPSGITGASPASLFTSDANAITNTTFSNVSMPSAPNVSLLSVAGITGSTRFQGICYDRDAHIGWCGDLAEVITFTTALNTAQRQAVEGYLAHKWGLTKYYSPSFPLSISGCQLWLDAADATTVTGTSNVTQWRDKSGNNRHLGVLVGGTTYSSNAINLNSSCMFVNSPVDLTKVTLFIVVKSTGGNNQTVFTTRSNTGTSYNSTDGFGFYMNGTTSMQFFGTYPASSSFAIDTSTPKLFSFQSSGTSISSWYNGISKVGSTLSSPRTSTARGFGIGAEWTNENGGGYQNVYVNVSIYEIIVFNSDVNTSDRENIEKYLMQKWGMGIIPSTHPYANYIPSPLARFAPTNIAGCLMWLDGADPNGTGIVPSAGAKSSWVDKTANGWNASQSVSARQPSLVLNSLNRRSGFSFTSPNNQSFITDLQSSLNTLSGLSVLAVLMPTWSVGQDVRNPAFFGMRKTVSSVLSTKINYYVHNDYSRTDIFNGSGVSYHFVSGLAQNTPFMYSGTNNNGTDLLYPNGSLTSDSAGANFGSGTNLPIIVGGNNEDFENWQGYIYEVVFFNSVLTTAQRQQVEGYLAQKWGLTTLPSGHPYKSFSPFPVSLFNFLPTMVSGCQLWLDGADPVGTGAAPTSGATVSTWNDKSGNQKHATATGISTYLSGGGVNFTGSSYFLNQTFAMNLSQRSIFVVFQATTTSYHAGVIVFIPTPNTGVDSESTSGMTCEIGFPNNLWFYGNSDGYRSMIGGSHPLPKAIYHDSMNGTTGSGYLNGSNATNVTAGYTAGTCSGYALSGRWQGGSMSSSNRLNGVIYEILVYNKVLTTTERQQVESYLAWKWTLQASLPSDHTYKFAPPSV